MKKIILGILFIIYILITLTVTFFLNKYNEFGVIEVRNRLIVTSNKTEMNYSKGSLIIIPKDKSNLKVDKEVFYYTADKHKILISKGKIVNIEDVTEKEKTITLENSRKYSIDYIIGKVEKATSIPLLGYLLMALTSRIGYLVIIMLPISIFFFYQLYSLFKRK